MYSYNYSIFFWKFYRPELQDQSSDDNSEGEYDDYEDYEGNDSYCQSSQNRVDGDTSFQCTEGYNCTIGSNCGIQGNCFNFQGCIRAHSCPGIS